MKEVVAEVRKDAPEALFELFELHAALRELVMNAQVLSAVAEEFTTQTSRLADAPESASREVLRELANVAAKTSEVAEGQADALAELRRGVDAWNLTKLSTPSS